MQHLSRADSEEIALAEMGEQTRNKFLHLQLVLIGDVVVAEEGSVHLVQGICRLVKVGTRSGVCGHLDSRLILFYSSGCCSCTGLTQKLFPNPSFPPLQ